MFEIASISPVELKAVQNQIVDVYREAFSMPPYDRRELDVHVFEHSLAHHALHKAFRCCVAREHPGGPILGFVYGYTSEPGQWWHDSVAKALAPVRVECWLRGSFEFVELAVAPAAQGRGIGGRLHDAILEGLPHHTAVLSTYQAETVALQLYRKRGWLPLLEHFYFPGNPPPYLIMGLDLEQRTGRLKHQDNK
jgi:ribosomal protein S18 acetylase RimI-like enzyme